MRYGNEWYVRVCCGGVIQGDCGRDERGFDADTRRKMAAKAYLRRHDSGKKGKEMYLSFDRLLWGFYMPDYPISKHTQSRGSRRIIRSRRRLFNLTPTRYNAFKLTSMEFASFLEKDGIGAIGPNLAGTASCPNLVIRGPIRLGDSPRPQLAATLLLTQFDRVCYLLSLIEITHMLVKWTEVTSL